MNPRPGGRRFHRKTASALTEINVTPFGDVMLVLLIIFMVTAPLMQSGVSVDLPKEETGSLEIRDENVVTIRKDGAIFYNDKRVSPAQLNGKLKNLASINPKAEIFLRADRRVDYGSVMAVMGAVKGAGIDRLGMVTQVPPASRPGRRK